VSLLYYGLACYAAIAFFGQASGEISDGFQPPVTVLKPLCGNDWEGYDCLASFCQQDYPTYQIIFCVQEETDPSVALVQKLQASFPQVEILLAIGQPNLGINPKINNLANALPQIRHNFLVIADSDIKVTPAYLKTIMQPFQDSK
ncbi:MAG: glycosyltransferase, partial [Microcystaceae cyanobacterium]